MQKSSKAFEEAVSLTNEKPLKKDIYSRLDELRFDVEIWEQQRFEWLYESLSLETEINQPRIADE